MAAKRELSTMSIFEMHSNRLVWTEYSQFLPILRRSSIVYVSVEYQIDIESIFSSLFLNQIQKKQQSD